MADPSSRPSAYSASGASGPEPAVLTTPDGATIAYHRRSGNGAGARSDAGRHPGVVFIHGFESDMEGGKALFLEDWCHRRGVDFLRFDQTGHGLSSGRFEDGTIGTWARDVVSVLDALTEGPQILVGSSMGGWLMLLAALARPQRVAGLLGIAAAPDFTEDLMWEVFDARTRETLAKDGRLLKPNAYDPDNPTVITRALIEDGRERLLLRGPLAIRCPVRLIHGQRDEAVPWRTALRILEGLETPDAAVTLVKDGEHRLSRPQDLARLGRVLEGLLDDLAAAESDGEGEALAPL